MTSRKRPYQESAPRLSVLKFCSILNGSNSVNSHDAKDLLQTLQTFVQVVRSERHAALHVSQLDDDDDDDEDDGDDDKNNNEDDEEKGHTKEKVDKEEDIIKSATTASEKRFKKDETWKEDTKSYQVPFVGTSLSTTSRQQDYGQVVESTWPCGLLQAYLIKSPMIQELLVFESTSNNNNNLLPRHVLRRIPPQTSNKQSDKKKSHHQNRLVWWQSQLVKAYLQALNEVLTVVLPLSKHQTTSLSDAMRQRLLSLFYQQVMPTVWQVLEQQKQQPAASDAGDKSAYSVVVPVAMQILVRLSSVSVTTARQVAQHLATTTKQATQSSWFYLPAITPTADSEQRQQQSTVLPNSSTTTSAEPLEQHQQQAVEPPPKKDGKKQKDHRSTKALFHRTCRWALLLVGTLLEWNDASILSTIMSPGAKERKLPPGFLYIALRASPLWKRAVVGSSSPAAAGSGGVEASEWNPLVDAALSRVLRALRSMLEGGVLVQRRPKLWMDLVSGGDAWQNLFHLAAQTPVSLWELHDQENGMQLDISTNLETRSSSKEAGRLLALLLTKVQDSPMLQILHDNDLGGNDDNASIVQAKNNISQQLVRAMIYLQDHRPSYGGNGLRTLHFFLLQCLQSTPRLAPLFFRTMTIPDLNKPFAVVACWHFISQCLKCDNIFLVNSEGNQEHVTNVLTGKLKHVVSKALQSSNALVVTETLKLILNLIEIYHHKEKANSQTLAAPKSNATKELDGNHLFELQVLLSVRSRWDPFQGKRKVTTAVLVVIHMCQVLEAVANIWPRMLMSSKYDWIKLLPLTSTAFSRSHPLLQIRLLRTLETLMKLQLNHEAHARFTSTSIRIVLEILIDKGTSPQVTKAAANVVSLRFRRLFLKNSNATDEDDVEKLELQACIEYEWDCWLKSVTSEALDGFLTIVDNAATKRSSHVISAAVAWEKAGLPGSLTALSFSPILLAALLELPNASPSLAHLTCQVATKVLFYLRFPLPLAAIISTTELNDQSENKYDGFSLLALYARSLVDYSSMEETKRSQVVQSLVEYAFGNESLVHLLPPMGSASLQWSHCIDNSECLVAIRLILHLLVCVQNVEERRSYCKVLRYLLLPVVTQKEYNAGQAQPMIHYLYDVFSGHLGGDTSFVDLALLSCPKSLVLHSLLEKLVPFISSPLILRDKGGTMSSSLARKSFLFNGLGRKLLPPSSASRLKESLLDFFTDESTEPLPVLEYFLLVWLSEQSSLGSTVKVPMNITFRAWCNLCSRSDSNDSNWQIARYLEVVLCQACERDDDGIVSTQLYALLQQHSAEDVIERCLKSKHALLSEATNNEGSCLLKLIIDLDVCVYLPIFICKVCEAEDSSALSQLFMGTSIDSAMVLATAHLGLLEATTRANLAVKLLSKARLSVARKEASGLGDQRALMMLIRCLKYDEGARLKYDEGAREIIEGAAEVVAFFIDRIDVQDNSTRTVILDAASCISLCFSRLEGGDSRETAKKSWISSVFCQLCNELPKVLRSFHRHVESQTTNNPDVPVNHLTLLQFILANRAKLSLPGDKAITVCLGNALRSCLKHGVTDTPIDRAVTSNCLKLARLLLLEAEALHGVNQCSSLSASTVFRMLVTHSKFRVALETTQENEALVGNSPRLELIRLLLCCVSLARAKVSFDQILWNTLFSSFNAGVTAVDAAIRRLIHVYTEALSERKETCYIFADEFRWSKESAGSGDVTPVQASGWDWLLTTLDGDRIRKTLQRFPILDTLYPQPLEEEKEWPSWKKESSTGTAEASDDEQNQACRTRDHEMDGPDTRYSPGFILPLILACLENVFPGDLKLAENGLAESRHEDDFNAYSQETQRDSSTGEIHVFVVTVKRLCDLGALSFALSALCSICPLVRKVSVAILAMILKALRSLEAAGLQEWRERPQLLMLVNSVQRSLAVRKAAQQDDGSLESSNVRRLPSVSAIFLARAATVLSKPGDAMFAPINRFFLKVEVEHGAYQDLTRLPAFISLFCSSSEEPPGQSQRERVWAVRLLKESFLDESCYRLVTACHAPALLQTFLATIRPTDHDKDGKTNILVINTLCRLLSVGGHNAHIHLVARTGFLSWLRCLLTEGSIVSTKENYQGLFLLVHLSIEGALKATTNDTRDSQTLFQEVVGLAQPIADISAKLFESMNTSTTNNDEDRANKSLIAAVRQVLWSLKLAIEEAVHTELFISVRQDGISLHSAASVLMRSGLDKGISVLLPLCILPVQVNKSDVGSIEEFCDVALTTLRAERESITNEDVEVVMARIALLIRFYDFKQPQPVSICKKLIAVRDVCFRHEKGNLAWLKCMAEFTKVDRTGSALLELTYSLIQ